MKEALSFDDVLIVPKFSNVKSRKDVDLSSMGLRLPIISSNMDTITGPEMANVMALSGGIGCLHRFMSIEDNVKMFMESHLNTWCSIGLGELEFQRAEALFKAGCETFVIDVAHAASEETVRWYNQLSLKFLKSANIIVGNFAHGYEILDFLNKAERTPYAFKVGIGGGSACSTRIKTGCGLPTFQSIKDSELYWKSEKIKIIADGGMRTPGDIAKALAAGASAVMLGGMLAGTDESAGYTQNYDLVYKAFSDTHTHLTKEGIEKLTRDFLRSNPEIPYRGSASLQSYKDQGKDLNGRTAEGESFMVPHKGPVIDVLRDIEGGLRSAFSYVGASNLKEFQERAEFVKVTAAGAAESKPHGKRD